MWESILNWWWSYHRSFSCLLCSFIVRLAHGSTSYHWLKTGLRPSTVLIQTTTSTMTQLSESTWFPYTTLSCFWHVTILHLKDNGKFSSAPLPLHWVPSSTPSSLVTWHSSFKTWTKRTQSSRSQSIWLTPQWRTWTCQKSCNKMSSVTCSTLNSLRMVSKSLSTSTSASRHLSEMKSSNSSSRTSRWSALSLSRIAHWSTSLSSHCSWCCSTQSIHWLTKVKKITDSSSSSMVSVKFSLRIPSRNVTHSFVPSKVETSSVKSVFLPDNQEPLVCVPRFTQWSVTSTSKSSRKWSSCSLRSSHLYRSTSSLTTISTDNGSVNSSRMSNLCFICQKTSLMSWLSS